MYAVLLLLAAQNPPDAPAPEPVEVVDTAPPPVATAATCVAPVRTVRRIAVADVETTDLAPRLESIFTGALVSELRKLAAVSVVGMDEVRAVLDQEAQRQAVGACTESSCLSDVADALGAEILVTARLGRVDGSDVISFRRIDMRDGKSNGVDRRFDEGDGEGFLAAIGPAVAELFPDLPLRAGATRGVAEEVGRRLNPPPLPPWSFFATAGAGVALLSGGAAAGLVTNGLTDGINARIASSSTTPIAGADLKRDQDVAQGTANTANALFVAGAVVAAAATGMAFFTDFWGYGDAQ